MTSDPEAALDYRLLWPRVFSPREFAERFRTAHGHAASDMTRDRCMVFSPAPSPRLGYEPARVGSSQWLAGDMVERRDSRWPTIEFVTEGTGTLIVNGTRYALKPNDAFILHPGEHHLYRAGACPVFRKRYVVYWENRRDVEDLFRNLGLARVSHVHLVNDAVKQANRIFDELETLAERKPMGYRRRSSLIAYELALLVADAIESFDEQPVIHPALMRALCFSRDTLGQPVTVADMARAAAVTPQHLIRLFKDALSKRPHEWLEQYRLSQAAGLLHGTDMRLEDIADHVGYKDPYYFSIAFKRVTGYSPTKYRAATIRAARQAASAQKEKAPGKTGRKTPAPPSLRAV